jgi:hypothetical protein
MAFQWYSNYHRNVLREEGSVNDVSMRRLKKPNLICFRVIYKIHVIQTGSGVHPASYPMGTGDSFPGVKRQGREADHSPLTSAEVKKMWIYTSTPPYVFMA